MSWQVMAMQSDARKVAHVGLIGKSTGSEGVNIFIHINCLLLDACLTSLCFTTL